MNGQYTVVARRYRPQTFQELIGQEHVARALTQAIATDRVGHAYLFTGARGVGKTSAARVLAKALNCAAGPAPTPCNRCDACESIAGGEDVDVLEIDGASNRGIDEIRQLRQNVAVRPSRARYKIYIIDEVHMLTKEAFNALLKTLEEPPEHVKFIFATTEPNKIPITILSRCQRFDFAGIDAQSIQTRLEQIAEAEGMSVAPEALQILASRASGSMRDSQSLLEQLLAVSDGPVTADDVVGLLGIAPAERLIQLVRHLVARRAADALEELDNTLAGGVEVGQLLDQLLGYFRDIMASTVGCQSEQLLYVLPNQSAEVAELGRQLGVHQVLAMLQILDQTAARMRISVYGRTLLEMAVVRICALEDLDALGELISELRNDGTAAAAPAPRAAQKKTPEVAATKNNDNEGRRGIDGRTNSANGQAVESDPAAANLQPVGEPPQPAARSIAAADEFTQSDGQALWSKVTGEVGGLVAGYAAVTVGVVPVADGEFVVRFRPDAEIAKQHCERSEVQSQLVHTARRISGRQVTFRFELAHPRQEPGGVADPPLRRSRRQMQAEIAEHPFVRNALATFEIEPGQYRYTPPGTRNDP